MYDGGCKYCEIIIVYKGLLWVTLAHDLHPQERTYKPVFNIDENTFLPAKIRPNKPGKLSLPNTLTPMNKIDSRVVSISLSSKIARRIKKIWQKLLHQSQWVLPDVLRLVLLVQIGYLQQITVKKTNFFSCALSKHH